MRTVELRGYLKVHRKRKFLGYSVTMHYKPKLKVATESVQRPRSDLRGILRRGRGRRLSAVIAEVNRAVHGWVVHYPLFQVRGVRRLRGPVQVGACYGGSGSAHGPERGK